MPRIRRAGLALLLSLGVIPATARAESADELTDAFVEIVDKSELAFEKSVRVVGVTKWSISIKFNVIGATSANMIREVEAHMRRLAQLSHIDIERSRGFILNAKGEREPIDDVHTLSDGFEFASMREDKLQQGRLVTALVDKQGVVSTGWLGNFSIIFGKRRQLERVFDHLVFDQNVRAQFSRGEIACFGTITIPQGSRDPHLAIVLIPTDQDAWLVRRCIVEETTQPLGLVNDIPGSSLTLFDDRFDRGRTELTAYDEMFLRVLYNPEIKLGMTGRELRKTARRLIEVELSKTR